MNKIPKFFRKRKTETGQEVQSPTKDILTPAELDKLKNKIRQEIATAELRIAYILKRQDRPKPGDKKEIEERETDIKHLRTKYQELLDPEITVYFAKKKETEPLTTKTLTAAEPLNTVEPLIAAAEPLNAVEPQIAAAEPLTVAEPVATEPIDQAPKIKPRRIKENRVSDLFDYREEDETRAEPLHIEEVTGKCIYRRALVTYSVNDQTEHCRRCNTEIQPKHDSDVDKLQHQLRDLLLTDKVEKVDVTEQRSLLQVLPDDNEDYEDEYFDDEQDYMPNQREEQNNNDHIYDSVDDQSDEENQQERSVFFRNY